MFNSVNIRSFVVFNNKLYAGTSSGGRILVYEESLGIPIITYSCVDPAPSNAALCAGDDQGLSGNVQRTLVSSCTSAKCEYTCNSGFTRSGNSCVSSSNAAGALSITTNFPSKVTTAAAFLRVNAPDGSSCKYSAETDSYDVMRSRALTNAPYMWLVKDLKNGEKTVYVACQKGGNEGRLSVRFTVELPQQASVPITQKPCNELTLSQCDTQYTRCRRVTVIGTEQICVNITSGQQPGIPITYSCVDPAPSNAALCAGDDQGLSGNVQRTLVSSCTSAKCEYTCNSGFTRSGNSCVSSSGARPPEQIACEGRAPYLKDDGSYMAGMTWGNTYRSADYTPTSWTYSESSAVSMGPCTWKCATGYQRSESGETCVLKTTTSPSGDSSGSSLSITTDFPKTITTTKALLRVNAPAGASCRISATTDVYDSMRGVTLTNSPYVWLATGLTDGQSKVYYVACKDRAGNSGKLTVSFAVDLPGEGTLCSGTPPSGDNYIRGPWTYTGTTGLSWTYDESATTSTACKWKCASGYTKSGNSCVAESSVVYVCTGQIPQNSQLCSGDDSGLSSNTPITLVDSDSCSAPKCQYTCVSGYVRSGNSCVAASDSGTGGGGGEGGVVVSDAITVSEYSTMSGRVTASSLGLVTGGTATAASGTSITYSTYIDLTSPQSADYELTYDSMRGRISRQLNFGSLPAVASRSAYFYKSVVEFQVPVALSEMPGMRLNLFGADYTVIAATPTNISFLRDAQIISGIKQGEVREFTFGGQKYSIHSSTIRASSVDSMRIRKEDASGYMDTLSYSSSSATKDMAQNSFERFGGSGGIDVGLKKINYTSLNSAANDYEVIIGRNVITVAENSETNNPGYFLDVETDSNGRIAKLVVYVTKSNEGRDYLIAGEKFTDPYWKSFRIKMGSVGDTQAIITVEKVA